MRHRAVDVFDRIGECLRTECANIERIGVTAVGLQPDGAKVAADVRIHRQEIIEIDAGITHGEAHNGHTVGTRSVRAGRPGERSAAGEHVTAFRKSA